MRLSESQKKFLIYLFNAPTFAYWNTNDGRCGNGINKTANSLIELGLARSLRWNPEMVEYWEKEWGRPMSEKEKARWLDKDPFWTCEEWITWEEHAKECDIDLSEDQYFTTLTPLGLKVYRELYGDKTMRVLAINRSQNFSEIRER